MDFSSIMPNVAWLVWLGIGVGFLVAEMIVPGFVMFFFGAGALIAGATAFAGVSVQMQILVFGVSSLGLLFLLRKTMAATFAGNSAEDDKEADPAIGSVCEVVQAIMPPQAGRIKYQGSFWSANCNVPVEVGELVRIVQRAENAPGTFVVTKEN